MSKTTRNSKNGSANRYVLLAVIVIAAIVLDVVAIIGTKSNQNTVEVGQTQNVTWDSNKIPREAVTINLIKKVSDNPNTYELVRTISTKTMNDGSATWVPAATDEGSRLSLEIGCTHGRSGCVAIDDMNSDLAVIQSDKFADTASAYSAIEAASNI